MKKVINKTNKEVVDYLRNTYTTKFEKEIFKEINGTELRINSTDSFEEEYECWKCGKKIKYYDEPNERVFCNECKEEHVREYNKILKQQQKIRAIIMLEKAITILESSPAYAHEYKKSYEYIKVKLEEKPTLFKSAEEVLVAMILHNFNYNFYANYKIKKYYVDFYIPELEVCLEVDGERHKSKTKYDKKRDIEIREELGSNWEVVRIPTNIIPTNPDKLIDAIITLKKEMQDSRKKYGIIEDDFSKREQDYYQSILTPKRKQQYFEKIRYNKIKKYFEKKKKKMN